MGANTYWFPLAQWQRGLFVSTVMTVTEFLELNIWNILAILLTQLEILDIFSVPILVLVLWICNNNDTISNKYLRFGFSNYPNGTEQLNLLNMEVPSFTLHTQTNDTTRMKLASHSRPNTNYSICKLAMLELKLLKRVWNKLFDVYIAVALSVFAQLFSPSSWITSRMY